VRDLVLVRFLLRPAARYLVFTLPLKAQQVFSRQPFQVGATSRARHLIACAHLLLVNWIVGFHFIQDNLQASLYPLCLCGEEARHKKEIQGSEPESTALDGLGALE